MASLVPCPSCGRHVRIQDSSCPFCAAAQPEGRTSPIGAPTATRPRAKRAIAFVAASMSVAACGSSTTTTTTPDGTTSASAAASSEPAPTTDTPVIDAPATRYGLPPFLAEDEIV